MDLNKGISTPIAIGLIVVISAVVGVLVWQFTKPAEEPTPKQPSDYTTQSACKDADYYWYNDTCHEEEQPEIANWDIYTNEKYGFEIGYPEECNIETGEIEGGFNIKFNSSNSEDFDICTGKFTVRRNEKGLPLEKALEDLYKFSDLRFGKVKTSSGITVLKPGEQSEKYYEKFGPKGSGLGYNYWITGNEEWIYSLQHLQDGGLLSDKMLSTFKFSEDIADGDETSEKPSSPAISSIKLSERSACCVKIQGECFTDKNEVVWKNKKTGTKFWGGQWPASSDGSQLLRDKTVESRKYEIQIPQIPEGNYEVVVINSNGQSESHSFSVEENVGGAYGQTPPIIGTISPTKAKIGDTLEIEGVIASDSVDVVFKNKDNLASVKKVEGVPVKNQKLTVTLPSSLQSNTDYLVSLTSNLGEEDNNVILEVN